ncbi:MAG: PAS domain S-box protein [Bdellovibrionota bacterium]
MNRERLLLSLETAASAIIALLSLPVLLGLSTATNGSFAAWNPMQANTAFSFLVLGTAIVLQAFTHPRASWIPAAFLCVVGSLTLLEHFFALNLGIDQLFRVMQAEVLSGHPGRMAPNSAASFLAEGSALFLLSQTCRTGRGLVTAVLAASLPCTIGIFALLGRIIVGFESVDSGSFGRVSVPAAIAMALAGAILVRRGLSALAKNPEESFRIIPTCATITFLVGVIALWQAQLQGDVRFQRERVAVEAERVKLEVSETLLQTSQALQRFSTRVEYLGTKDKKFLEIDGHSYLEQLPILKRIGILDAEYRVIWSYPNAISHQVSNFGESSDPVRREAIEDARVNHKASLSRVVTLRSGGSGFIIPVPLYSGGKFSGAVYGSVEAARLFHSFANDKNFSIGIFERGREIFRSGQGAERLEELKHRSEMSWGKTTWEIEAIPTPEFVDLNRSYVPYYILFFGVLTSILFGAFLQNLASTRKEALASGESVKLHNLRMRIALDAGKMGAWSVNIKTGAVWRSENHDLIFGHASPLSYWDQKTFVEHVLPEDRDAVVASIQRAIRERKPDSIEFRIRRADDSSIRWLSVMTQMTGLEKGAPEKLVGVVRDVTEEKQVALARQAELDLRKGILSSSNIGIISTDANGVIQTFNEAASRMLGYSSAELIGRETPAIFHSLDETIIRADQLSRELGREIEPGLEAFVAKARDLNVADEGEWTYIRKDGSRFPASSSVTVLRGPTGEVTGYLAMVMDLSERKRAQDQLFLMSERLTRVIEASGEGIWEREYAPDGKVQFVDAQAKKIFGFAENEEFDFDKLSKRVPPEDLAACGDVIRGHLDKGTSGYEIEFRIHPPAKDSQVRWVQSHGRVLNRPGMPPLLVSTVKDITDAVAKRQQLRDALHNAEEATRVKAEFLANMSHEIRTPLNGVIGMADLLLETPLEKEQKNYARIIQQSGAALLALVNDILDFSKIEAGKLELESVPFSLNQLVEGQADVLIAKAKEKGLSLMTFVAGDLPATLVGDPGRIGQILLNLTSNAIKFSERGGVSIRVMRSPHKPLNGLSFVRFEVEDSGIGLTPDVREKLFQPFVQADESMARKYGGTGLGLSICRRLAQSMKGEIDVESTSGKGSRFWFDIPFDLGAEEGMAATLRKALSAPETIRGLVVDDDPVAVDILGRYLISWGMRSGPATNFEGALPAIRKAALGGQPYSFALIGFGPRDERGLTLAREIQSEFGAGAPKLILLNEFGASVNESVAAAAGFSQAVSKPVKQSSLFDAIVKAMHGQTKPGPISEASAAAPEKEKPSASARILLADDVPVNQMVTMKMLESLGYTAHATANGYEVLDALSRVHYDLVLMDCQMPEMDGFEATRRIRESADPRIARIPVVALTANAMAGDDKKCLAAGMDDYLSKPMKKEALRGKLEKWLSNRRNNAA